MWIEWSTTSGFANPTRVRGPDLLMDSSDGTGRIDLQGLPAGQDIFYRVVLEDFASANVRSPAVQGHFRTPLAAGMPATRPLRLVWRDRKSTRLNSSHLVISYAVFCLKKKKNMKRTSTEVT